MSAVESLAVATTVWGVAMAVAPTLQIMRIRRERSSAGVSALHIAVLLVGFALWLAYGVTEESLPLILSNVVALAVNGAWLACVIRDRRASAPL